MDFDVGNRRNNLANYAISETLHWKIHMNQLNSYRLIKLNEKITTGVFQTKYFCKDPEGLPFLLGNDFLDWTVNKDRVKAVDSAINYLQNTFYLLSHFYKQDPKISFLSPIEEIRQATKNYIKNDLGWNLRRHRNGNYIIENPVVNKETGEDYSKIMQSTLQTRIMSWKIFYKFLIDKGIYSYPNPFDWEFEKIPNKIFHPQMPSISGMTVPPKRKHWIANTYFCNTSDEWNPIFIDDYSLPDKLLPHIDSEKHLVYKIITRILLEGGPRIHEVLSLNIGDWRNYWKNNGARAINKGSGGAREKIIFWNSITERMIRNYVNNQRREYDRFNRETIEIADDEPFFINQRGNRISYISFYKHWDIFCKKAKLKVTIHQIRHWFVTAVLRRINVFVDLSEKEGYRKKFISYMDWKCNDTILIYDHFLEQISDEELIDVFFREYHPDQEKIIRERNTVDLSPEALRRIEEFQKFLDQEI